MTDKPSAPPPPAMGILERRRIEAEIIKPLYEEMKAAFGAEAAKGVIERAVKKAAIAQAKSFASQEKAAPSLDSFEALQPLWRREDALAIRPVRRDAENLDFDVTRCRYAELYHAMGLGEIGHLLSCNRDASFIEGYAPGIEMTRTQTIMQGATHCDFKYRAKPVR
ncbi:MAG: L-2-amino-thiazoline-4-carboxylic acid hydrolase [Alphaproteobacteria bacterium]|nr:L-2-amino-thiazoline-4-carboxylic acid hydrolase [Alphaproteobacteria bacterium]